MKLNGRKVVNVEVDDVDPRDYPDFCDAHFSYAEYEDTGEELEEADLELLNNDYPDVVNEMAFEYYI
ncbi:MAG: hypothetical protein ACKOD7_07215 [Polynucleobacter victoriensis]